LGGGLSWRSWRRRQRGESGTGRRLEAITHLIIAAPPWNIMHLIIAAPPWNIMQSWVDMLLEGVTANSEWARLVGGWLPCAALVPQQAQELRSAGWSLVGVATCANGRGCVVAVGMTSVVLMQTVMMSGHKKSARVGPLLQLEAGGDDCRRSRGHCSSSRNSGWAVSSRLYLCVMPCQQLQLRRQTVCVLQHAGCVV
jgi:hypothetical protein